jgi:hypothetical protein
VCYGSADGAGGNDSGDDGEGNTQSTLCMWSCMSAVVVWSEMVGRAGVGAGSGLVGSPSGK